MRILFIFTILIFVCNFSLANIIKPNPDINPKEVIEIQLNALKSNDNPFINAGIEQTWEFAHPFNRQYTGPLKKFIKMMYSPAYSKMINHQDFNIIFVSNKDDISYYFIELIDKSGDEYGFQWTVQKVLIDGEYKNCWMTIGVSQPILLSNTS